MSQELLHIVETDDTARWGLVVPVRLEFYKPKPVPEGKTLLTDRTALGPGYGQITVHFNQDPVPGATLDWPPYMQRETKQSLRIFNAVDAISKSILRDFFLAAETMAPTLRLKFGDSDRTYLKDASFWVGGPVNDHPYWAP
jgi:hypothetical protein